MKNSRSLSELLIKSFWPYWVGAVILGFLNIILTIIYKPWPVTGVISYWGLRTWSFFQGYSPVWNDYFTEIGVTNPFARHPLFNKESFLNFGIVTGVLLAASLAGQFRIKKIKSPRQVIFAITGGILMGYGARLALGCNAGALIGGITSQSLHGWVFGVFLFLGSLTGTRFVKYYFKKTG